MAIPVFLDTDIGDDVDDLLALAIACASPEIELQGVGTVFGPTRRRTRVARSVVALTRRTIPVYAGAEHPLTPKDLHGAFARRIVERFSPETGIRLHTNLGLPADELPPIAPETAAVAIARFWERNKEEGVTVGIGPMTNLALALRLCPPAGRFVVMAGRCDAASPEWNVLCDPIAAEQVFESGIPVKVIPWKIGVDLSFSRSEVASFTSLCAPLSDLFREAIELWTGQGFAFHVWDLLAVLASFEPHRFAWKTGRIRVDTSSERLGATDFKEDPNGPHRYAEASDREATVERLLELLRAAALYSEAPGSSEASTT